MPRLLPDGADNHNRVADLSGGVVTDIESTIIIKECLDCLTPRQREAVMLWAEDYNYREIGEIMGISAPAVFYLIQRARERMEYQNRKSVL